MAVDPGFVGAIPLYEYAKHVSEDTMERAMVDIYVETSDVLAALPIRPVNGGKYRYPQVAALPDVSRRAYNEPGNTSQGRTEVMEEGIFIMDEYIYWDRAMEDHYGSEGREIQERLRMISMAREATRVILKGDNLNEPRDPDGFQARSLWPEQTLVHNSASSGGGPLSLAKLDELLNEVAGATHLVMNRTWKPLWMAAARSPTLTNNVVNMDKTDPLGRKVLSYGETPILFGYPKSEDDDILPFTEVASGGGGAVTGSIYAVRFAGEDGIFMIEGVPLAVEDEGQLPGLPRKSTHIKWDWGLVSKPWSVGRLTSITNAAIVA
jgi:hypothetical protein